MVPAQVPIVLTFTSDDQVWLRRSAITPPAFWAGHVTPPALGDVLRIGGRQFAVVARVWEHDGLEPRLRLYLGPGRADSDTALQELGN